MSATKTDKTISPKISTSSSRVTFASASVKNVSSKGKMKKVKKSRHPPTSHMVTEAIKDLNDRRGSSLQAIKKYISAKYNLNIEKISFYIRKYIKLAVESGNLVQTKGTGANGSFKLNKIQKNYAKISSKLPKKLLSKKGLSKKKKNIVQTKQLRNFGR